MDLNKKQYIDFAFMYINKTMNTHLIGQKYNNEFSVKISQCQQTVELLTIGNRNKIMETKKC